MNIGSLYLVKKWFWLLFPSKETAATANIYAHDIAVGYAEAHHGADRESVAFYANWLSKELKCEVTYFSPDSYIVCLENDGRLKKVLTSDGRIGWIWFIQDDISCFEEAKTEQ